MCDGKADCPLGSDEAGCRCEAFDMTEGNTLSNNSVCLPPHWAWADTFTPHFPNVASKTTSVSSVSGEKLARYEAAGCALESGSSAHALSCHDPCLLFLFLNCSTWFCFRIHEQFHLRGQQLHEGKKMW